MHLILYLIMCYLRRLSNISELAIFFLETLTLKRLTVPGDKGMPKVPENCSKQNLFLKGHTLTTCHVNCLLSFIDFLRSQGRNLL